MYIPSTAETDRGGEKPLTEFIALKSKKGREIAFKNKTKKKKMESNERDGTERRSAWIKTS